MTDIGRCGWAKGPLYLHYHDTEWGVPIRHDDRALFERLCLEGAQAGLSWITILRKRDHYRLVFDQFDPEKVARYDEAKIAHLLADPGIVRNSQHLLAIWIAQFVLAACTVERTPLDVRSFRALRLSEFPAKPFHHLGYGGFVPGVDLRSTP